MTVPTKKKQKCVSHQLMFYHKKCKTVAGSKPYDKFTPTDAQNTMGTKLMLVHRKLMIAGSTDNYTERAFVCLSRKVEVHIY